MNGTDNHNVKQLYDIYRDSLIAFAKRYVVRDDVAQDLVQEAFIRLWEKDPSFSSEAAFRSYLFTSVKNLSLDYLKHQDIENHYAENYLKEASISARNHAEEIFDKEVMELLFKLIDRLPLRCREIFLLSLDGQKASEIAFQLEISVETVRTQKKKAMKMLRTYFHEENSKEKSKKKNISFSFFFFRLLYPI